MFLHLLGLGRHKEKCEGKKLVGAGCDGTVEGESWGTCISGFGGAMVSSTFPHAELMLGKLAWLEQP